jgi:hypothetical protein
MVSAPSNGPDRSGAARPLPPSRSNPRSSTIYFSRSSDQARTWSHPSLLSAKGRNVQFPDIAITGNGNVYVLWVSDDTIAYARSTDCGATFSKQRTLLTFIPNSASDALAPEAPRPTNPAHDEGSGEESSVEQGDARDCGSVYDHRESGYTFFRRDSQVRASADQKGNDSYVYLVCDATIPGTVEDAETTYSTVPGDKVGQARTIWWDSRNDPRTRCSGRSGTTRRGMSTRRSTRSARAPR